MTKKRNNAIFFSFIVFLLVCCSVLFLVDHQKKGDSHSEANVAPLTKKDVLTAEKKEIDSVIREPDTSASRVEIHEDKPATHAEEPLPKKRNILDRLRHRTKAILQKFGF